MIVVYLWKPVTDDALTRAKILCRGVREEVRIVYHNQSLTVTISMGVAFNPLYATNRAG
jgi:hypothetical protein